MSLRIHQFPCLEDNYGFLVKEIASGKVACVDTPDSDQVLSELNRLGWTLDLVFNTHWHPDHAGGNAVLKAATGAAVVGPEEVHRIVAVDQVVTGGDHVMLGETRFEVLDVGGHTLGHIAFHSPADDIVFVGDALFPMGCGRMFEGTFEQMWASLCRLAALPENTFVYSAHEYSQANARFALTIDDSVNVQRRAASIDGARAKNQPTVPTTIRLERATNPFLRAPQLAMARGAANAVEAFAMVRTAKDNFKEAVHVE
ncbi:MAG: hydroxyacylglutathione hydrolase [Sphingomonadaceae bacterium]